jgi:hypothetical protein
MYRKVKNHEHILGMNINMLILLGSSDELVEDPCPTNRAFLDCASQNPTKLAGDFSNQSKTTR